MKHSGTSGQYILGHNIMKHACLALSYLACSKNIIWK